MSSSRIKPIVTAQTEPDKSVQFKHFGVLDDGKQGKGSLFTSVTVNLIIAIVVCVIGAAAKKTIEQQKLVSLTFIPNEPPKPPKPKPILKPPPPMPKPPEMKLEPPKITVPEVKMPEPPKVPVMKVAPVNLPPAPPKLVKAPPAPQVVNLSHPQAAAIANNQVASPIRLGQMDNPIKTTGPAVSNINLGQAGAQNMPASNSGLGAVSKVNLAGNGSPSGTTMKGANGVQNVQGVKLGVPGGTGPLDSKGRGAAAVSLAAAPPPPPLQHPATTAPTTGGAPKVLFKPAPEYTAEARAKHIEGTITVKIRVAANGAVTVLGLSNDLGYGLGNSAMRAVQGTRFQPATDAQGHPVDWTGQVNVLFQLAG